MEDKQEILNKLLEVFHLTAAGENIEELRYNRDDETVRVDFPNNPDVRIINVAKDSGFQMLIDIMKDINIL
jgi:hypothetical protein